MSNTKNTFFAVFRKGLRISAIVLMIATFALLLECVFFQRNALRYKEEPLFFKGSEAENLTISTEEALAKLTDEEQNAIEVQRENERLIAEYYGEEYTPEEDETLVEKDGKFYRKIKQTTAVLSLKEDYFIQKFALTVPLEEDGGYNLTLYKDGQKVKEGMYCSVNAKIDTGVTNVGAFADEIVIVLNTGEEVEKQNFEIKLSNDFNINVMRFFFLFVTLSIFIFLIYTGFFQGRKFGKWEPMASYSKRGVLVERTESVFIVTALLLGSLLICGIGTNQVGFDEYVHEKTAYDLSFGSTIETTEAAMQMKGNLLPYFNNPEERALVEAYEQRISEEIDPDITHQSRMVRTETRVYYPMAAGFFLARVLDVDFATSMAMAKFGNLLMYICVVWLAIRLAKRYKLLVTIIGLLPNNIFIASSITYDAVVTAFLLLGTVLMINEILEPDRKLTWGNLLLMLLSFEIGCLSKPIYIVMVLMLVFFGKRKFENRTQEVILKLAVIVMAFLMLYNIFRPTPVSGGDYALVSDFSYAGDPRNTGSSVTGQIAYILQNPLVYTKLLLASMWEMFRGYVCANVPFVGYAYLGFASSVINWIFMILGVIAAFVSCREDRYEVSNEEKTREKRSAIGVKFIVLNLIMCFGTAAIVYTSMYVSYTAVGADIIEGVQGRYFIPLFLPLFSCLFINRVTDASQRKGKFKKITALMEQRMVYAVVLGIAIAINLIMTYGMVITKLNV